MLRVAELSVIHIHGILACSVSVFSLFAYSISTSSSSPEDFLKSSYLLVVVIFFFLYVKDRNQINQQQEEEKEGEREREGKKETEMRQRCSARRTLPPFILPNIPVTNPFALEHNFQSGRDPFTTLFLLFLLHLSGEDRKERKENKGGGSSCTRTLLAR